MAIPRDDLMRRPEALRTYRDDCGMVPGYETACRRLSKFNGDLTMAFNSLDIEGFDYKTARAFLHEPLQAMLGGRVGDERREMESRLLAVLFAFAVTLIEAERASG